MIPTGGEHFGAAVRLPQHIFLVRSKVCVAKNWKRPLDAADGQKYDLPTPDRIPTTQEGGIPVGVRVSIDDRGRLPIPAETRRQLGFLEGDTVMIEPLGPGEFRAVKLVDAVKKAKGMYRELRSADESVTDQLIADRRREAKEDQARRG